MNAKPKGTAVGMKSLARLGSMMLGLALLSACASQQPKLTDISTASCGEKLNYAASLISHANVQNAVSSAVPGYPFLRANRNSVLMGEQVGTALQAGDGTGEKLFADWVGQMRELDREARFAEIRNLPVAPAVAFAAQEACADQMADGLDVAAYDNLSKAVFVPDDYLDFQRIAGFYPLTAFAAHFGYEGWKRDNLQSFDLPVSDVDAMGDWQVYALSGGVSVGVEYNAITRDGFGRLLPTDAELLGLVSAYAPEIRVREESSSDRIGRPVLVTRDTISTVDMSAPTMFYRLGHTYLNGVWLPQISYAVWFPKRPKQGAFDILAGHLDALVWRVTLDQDGSAILADSIHGCGCYHMFFPGEGIERITAPEDGDIRETAEMPAGFLARETLAKPVLWVDAVSHYLLKVSAQSAAPEADSKTELALIAEQALYSIELADGSGYASLYDEDGFVPGTDRLERFFLWPMGVERPGAMRQWGHHATAFVGRRHFDDPLMLNRYFQIR